MSNKKDIDINFEVEQINQFKDIKASLRRFIETYQNNVGLSLLDGILGLLSQEFGDREKQNIVFAFKEIFRSEKFGEKKKNEINFWAWLFRLLLAQTFYELLEGSIFLLSSKSSFSEWSGKQLRKALHSGSTSKA